MKTIKRLILLGIVVFLLPIMFMGIYTKTATFPGKAITEWGGGIWEFDHTFVAATDTVYMPINPPRPKSSIDTVAFILDMGAAPYGQTGTNDTVDVYWGFQWSDDNSNWSTLTQLGTDSTKTGTEGVFTWTTYTIGSYKGNGIHPYYRVVAIGKSVSGGAINVIGNKIKVFALRQYSY